MSDIRLIDANALLSQIPTIEDKYKIVRKLIDNAPTVVVDCKNCDGYEAGYSAGVHDTERPQGEIFPMEIVAGKCPIDANGDCPLRSQGEWIKWNFKTFGAFGDWEYKCSNCGKVYGGEYNFCPNCGADMRKTEGKT